MNKQILVPVLMAFSLNVTAADVVLSWSGKVKSIAASPTNVEVKMNHVEYYLNDEQVRELLHLNSAASMDKDQLIILNSEVPVLSLAF